MIEIIAIIFMLIFSYYDIFNKRVIPDWISYSFMIISFIGFMIMPFEIIKLGTAILVFILGYIIYRMGYIGGADVFAITGIILLFPFVIQGIPSVILILLGSMLLTMIYVMLNFFIKNKNVNFKKQDIITACLWIIGYSALAYMIYNIGQYTMGIIVFILGFINSLFALIKTNLMDSMIEIIPLDKIIEEDILVIDKMDKKLVEENKLDRLLTNEQINKLKELGVKEVPVYTGLPPYLPFVTIVTILIFLLTIN